MKKILAVAGLALTLSGVVMAGSMTPAQLVEAVSTATLWKAASPLQSYSADQYPRGQAIDLALLNEYGFVNLTRLDLQKGTLKVTLEITEMLDPIAAFGLFTCTQRDGRPLERIGNLGEDLGQAMVFAQNKYYVRLAAATGSPEIHASLLELARIISQMLPSAFSPPSLVTRLPKENLIKNSVVFALGHRALNQKHQLAEADIFGLSNGAEAVLAQYEFPTDSATLLLIGYPTQQLAKKLLESGYQAYTARHPGQSVFYKREGPVAVLVLGAKSAEVATALLDQVNYVSTVSWDPKAQPLGVAKMMLNIFTYTGIMLLFALIGGIVFGIIRVVVKTLFPGKVFDRPENAELIKLNLQFPRK